MAAPDAREPAPWERSRGSYLPRQIWGRLLDALQVDLRAGASARSATVRVVHLPRRKQPHRLHVEQFNERTIRRLRQVPLLLLDATLHPVIAPLLQVERTTIRYAQGRSVVQALTSLHDLRTLRCRVGGQWELTPLGRRAVARCAAWFQGRPGYIFCRLGLEPLFRAEAQRYYELRRVHIVTPRRERGWDADPTADVFAVVGRYARDEVSCEREAHALRSIFLRLEGSTAALGALEKPARALLFKGRGAPVTYLGEMVERPTREPADRLAALIQDADRVAAVQQFIGRERHGKAYVLLLRGDPTVPADALVEDRDLPEAIPADVRATKSGRTHNHEREVEDA